MTEEEMKAKRFEADFSDMKGTEQIQEGAKKALAILAAKRKAKEQK